MCVFFLCFYVLLLWLKLVQFVLNTQNLIRMQFASFRQWRYFNKMILKWRCRCMHPRTCRTHIHAHTCIRRVLSTIIFSLRTREMFFRFVEMKKKREREKKSTNHPTQQTTDKRENNGQKEKWKVEKFYARNPKNY